MSSLDSTGSRVIELTKKKLFTPSQKEKIKRRSLLQAGIVENSENEVEDQRQGIIIWKMSQFDICSNRRFMKIN